MGTVWVAIVLIAIRFCRLSGSVLGFSRHPNGLAGLFLPACVLFLGWRPSICRVRVSLPLGIPIGFPCITIRPYASRAKRLLPVRGGTRRMLPDAWLPPNMRIIQHASHFSPARGKLSPGYRVRTATNCCLVKFEKTARIRARNCSNVLKCKALRRGFGRMPVQGSLRKRAG